LHLHVDGLVAETGETDESVHEQDAVEVVNLVLQHDREETFRSDLEELSLSVTGMGYHLGGAGNRAGLLGDVIHGYYQDSPFIRFNLYV